MRLNDLGQAMFENVAPVAPEDVLAALERVLLGPQGEAPAKECKEYLDLLRSREWLDVPMVLANGHIAKLTFEKGPSGQRALDDAIASWQAQ